MANPLKINNRTVGNSISYTEHFCAAATDENQCFLAQGVGNVKTKKKKGNTMTYTVASETPGLSFLRFSYTFPTVPHCGGEGVGNVGNTYRFPTFLHPTLRRALEAVQ